MRNKDLLMQACQARAYAYAPYSGYRVGAALLTSSGQVFTGSNVENASYGLTVCAERTAVFKAVSEGYTDFEIMAVVGSNGSYAYPCGACRQVLAEFAPDMKVLVGDETLQYTEHDLRDLLPYTFKIKGQE